MVTEFRFFLLKYHCKNKRRGCGLNMSLLLHQTPLLSDILTVDFFITGIFISVYPKGLDFALMMECPIWSRVLLLKTQTIQPLMWKIYKTWVWLKDLVFVLLVSKKLKRFWIFLNVSMIFVLLLSLQSKSESFTHTNERGHGSSPSRNREDSEYKQDYFTVISTAASRGNLAGESNMTLTVQNKHTLSPSQSLR